MPDLAQWGSPSINARRNLYRIGNRKRPTLICIVIPTRSLRLVIVMQPYSMVVYIIMWPLLRTYQGKSKVEPRGEDFYLKRRVFHSMVLLPFIFKHGTFPFALCIHVLLARVSGLSIPRNEISYGDWGGLGYSSVTIVISSTNQTIPGLPAGFGPEFDNKFKGELIRVAGDRFGCETPSRTNTTEYVGKIVLVQRGKCSYITKVMNIQERGGIAVIVGDNVPRNWLLAMYADGFWTPYEYG